MHERPLANLWEARGAKRPPGPLPLKQLDEFKQCYRQGLRDLSALHIRDCLDGEDYASLNIKLDNLKLRFAIWGRATEQHLKPKILASVLETIAKICSLIENEDIFEVEYGIVRIFEESRKQYVENVLARAYKIMSMNAAIEETRLVTRLPCDYVIVDSIRFLGFLQHLKEQIDDLVAATGSAVNEMALISQTMEGLNESDLKLIHMSGLVERDLIANAAFTRLSWLKDRKGKQKAVTFDLEEIAGSSSSRAQTDAYSEAGSSWTFMTPATSVAAPDLVERFAILVERGRDSDGDLLMQDIPIERMAQRRILTEMRRADDAPPFTSLSFIGSSINHILGIIAGPPETPYENGIFFLKFEITDRYPLSPPKCRFITKIYHPNIDVSGNICMNVLDDDWRPVWGLADLLLAVMSVLGSPNPKDFSASEAASVYQSQRSKFEATARNYTERYATGEWPSLQELCTPIPVSSSRKAIPHTRDKVSEHLNLW